ncbi:hypothetical protein BCR36DRAFT_586212 [Piromyces finnis]|uniref:Uncharacterized protein n=1 Tax=Piromyces finnis TaxID=1754191 RepID=A0A1Y1V009_9FUNG|nr:hypothetical protein BCR36DRAFT_586212 [Piromyces finnis]|eukprot:ORX44355.1 hypothetical protein BCR36DRAFT_586212 [Piromyces finnis]
MESERDQNDDLQIQNLSDDEELYHSGVDEAKPVTIKSNSQNSLQDLTEGDQERYEDSDYVVTKEKIFEKTITTTKVIRRSVPTVSETETNGATEEYDDITSRPTTTNFGDEFSDGESKSYNNDEVHDTNEIKTRSIINNIDNVNSTDDNKRKENEDSKLGNNISEIKSRSISNDITNKNVIDDKWNGNGNINLDGNISEIKTRSIVNDIINKSLIDDEGNENENINLDGNISEIKTRSIANDIINKSLSYNKEKEENINIKDDLIHESTNSNKNLFSNQNNEQYSSINNKNTNNNDNNDYISKYIYMDSVNNNDNSNDSNNNNKNEQKEIDEGLSGNRNKDDEKIKNNNTNNDKNEFDNAYLYKLNDNSENHQNMNMDRNKGTNNSYNKTSKSNNQDTVDPVNSNPYIKNKIPRPRTAVAGKQRNRNNSCERNIIHNRLHTCPLDKQNKYEDDDNDNHNMKNLKREGMKNRKLKKIHFGDENPDDSDFDKKLRKGMPLSTRNAIKNSDIGKIRNRKVQEELDRIEMERQRVIAGDISIHSSEDESENNNDKKTNRNKPSNKNTTISKNNTNTKTKANKKKKSTNKKSLKNNYRAFVSIKPSCNRYMANMWNNYVYSIHKMNILNIKKTVDNDSPKRYVHIDQKLKARQMKKEKDDEIRKNNQNILNRMIYQGKNNVGTSNLDDNNDVIEPVFRSLHIDQNRRLENEMNRESMTLLKRLKEKKPYCSVDQWKKERLITEMYLRNISTYPENYPIRQKTQQKHVPPIKKNDNEELKREKSPLEQTELIYGAKLKSTRPKRCSTTNATGTSTIRRGKHISGDTYNSSSGRNIRKCNNNEYRSTLSTSNKEDYPTSRVRKPKHRTLSESTSQSVKLYADTSINQNQVDRLFAEHKRNNKLYKVPEDNTTTAFDRVLNNYEKVESFIKDEDIKKTTENNDVIKNVNSDINELYEDTSTHLKENESKPPIEEIPVAEIEKK